MTTITILTQSSCAFCEQAKGTLSRLALEYPLQFREISLETVEGLELAAQYGVIFAPGILVDGEMFSYGRLPEKRLRRLLSQHLLPGVRMNDRVES